MKEKIAQVVVGLPVEGPFDYTIGKALRPPVMLGTRVWVSFGIRKRIGFVVGVRDKSLFKQLKPILSVIDQGPVLDEKFLKLTRMFSRYYGCSWGEAIEAALPQLLRRGRKIDIEKAIFNADSRKSNADGRGFSPQEYPGESALDSRKSAFKEIILDQPLITLLHVHGGFDPWPLIAERIEEAFFQHQGIIFLVPEASFIEPVSAQLKKNLSFSWIVWDPKMPKQQLQQWLVLKQGETRMVIGTRSAVFAPLPNLGLLILYQEENRSYKQEQSPCYHARQIAGMRAVLEGAGLLLVSSSPSAEVWRLGSQKKIHVYAQPPLPGEKDPAPLDVIDLSNYRPRKTPISFPLRNRIEETLNEGGKIVLMMNRRGFSRLTRCGQCGYTFQCPRCAVNLRYSYARKKLVCQRCNFSMGFPSVCPQCQNAHLKSWGIGIEKLESELARIFPQAKIVRYEKESHKLPPGFDILVSTQAVLRLRYVLKVDLIGWIQVDSELNHPDFRAAERLFSTLINLRQWAQRRVVVQTCLSDHYCFKAASRMDSPFFYRQELKLRQELGLPPFQHLVAVGVRAPKEDTALEQAYALYSRLKELKENRTIEIVEPHPDVVPKLRDKYRFTILFKGKSIPPILRCIKNALKGFKRKKDVTITVNVDP